MKTAMKKLIRGIVPASMLQRLWPWGSIHSRDASRNGWYNGKDYQLFPNFTIDPLDTFVDVGCGDGTACMFAANCGAEVIGVDIDEALMADLAKRLKKSAARQSQALVSDGHPLPLEDAIATRVVCQEVLEHVPDPRQFVSELVRIGKPGARYLLTVPDPVGESIQKKIAPPAYWAPPNHVRIFQREDFSRLVVDSGLRIEKRTRYSYYWAMWWTLFWGANKPVKFGSGETPVLHHWNKLWGHMVSDPNYAKVVDALDDLMPKSQIIIAVKD